MKEDIVEQPAYVLVKARALRELTEAVNAANLDVAKLHHRLTADGCYVPNHPLYAPLTLHGPLSWTDDLADAFQSPPGDRETEGFSDPRAASGREVRDAVMALQSALGVVEDGIVGPATMQAIERISSCPKDDLAASLRDVVGARLNADGSATAVMRSDRVTIVDAPPPDVLKSMVANLRPAGPVVNAAFVDGRMKVFHDGVPAPDSPWQHAFDAQQHDADRVMVRAVEPSHPGPGDDRDTWVLDPDATGHRAPFSPGDLVVRSSGRAGIHRVVAVSMDGDEDAPRHRSLRLRVEPQDVVVDADAF